MAGNPYLWSTTATSNDTIDSDINWAEGQLPSSVNNSARGMMAGIAGWLKDTNATLTTGGSANAQTVTTNVNYAALATGLKLVLKAGFSNTGAATLTVTPSGGGAFSSKSIKIVGPLGEVDPTAGQIKLNAHHIFEYDSAANSAAGAWILLNPSSADATQINRLNVAPEGRLTLVSGTPVMTSTTASSNIVYYTPYIGQLVPIYDGTRISLIDTGGELSQTTADNTKSPAAVAASKLYDMFLWNDSGTIRCTRGPAWSSDSSRGTGAGTSELTRSVSTVGLLMNANAITNGPAALRGTYVGSIRSNPSSTIDFVFGGTASGGSSASLAVANYYNRINVQTAVQDNGAQYSYTLATVREARGGVNFAISFISTFGEDAVLAVNSNSTQTAAVAGARNAFGIGLDQTTVFTNNAVAYVSAATAATTTGLFPVTTSFMPGIGWHTITGNEQGDNSNAGQYNIQINQTLTAMIRL